MDIKGIYKSIEGELKLVNEKLHGVSSSKHILISEVVSHIISNGKRVRPALTILIAKAFGVKNIDGVVNSAFAVELIHTASLLHDDVVDGTKKRRGKKTANILWGNKEVILVGDHLFTQAFLAVASLKKQEAIEIIANASHNLTIGEIVQLENEENYKVTFEEYLKTIYNKTASLFEASAMLGGVFSENANVDLCKDFGKNIGIAFQIMDDVLDYSSSTMFNKDIGTDFREKKMTLPVIILMKSLTKDEKKQVVNYFSGKDILKFEEILQLMEKYNIIQRCNEQIEYYINLANDFVNNNIQDAKIQKLLLAFLNFFTERKI